MPRKIKSKLQDMKRQAELEQFSPHTTPGDRHAALGRAIACSLLLAGMAPETLLEAANHPIFHGAGDQSAIIQVAEFFKDLI